MKIESYPIQIIPKLTYKSQIDLTQINTPPSNYVLIRRSLKDYNNTFDDLGFLRRDSLVSKLSSTIGLSMYFLTKIHESKFFKFRIFNSASKPWSEGERVRLSDYSKCIEIITPYCLIYFKLNDIDGKKIPYKKNFEKKEKKKIFETFNIDKDLIDDFELSGETKIKHKPIKLNYWHIEFHIARDKFIEDGKIIDDVRAKWKEKLVENALSDILIVNGKQKNENHFSDNIPSKLYKLSLTDLLMKVILPKLKFLFDNN
ncbi:MAG: hypothetical protein IIA49_03775 [Bacteroidetes bacterium]|nr:hypothetical protein [Bacteroidota bacterium]